MSCMPYAGGGLGLIAIGLGYLVFLAARKEKKELKDLGLAIGVIMMLLGTLSLVTSLYFKFKPFLKGSCPVAAKQHSYQQLPKEQEPPDLGFTVKK